MTDTDIIIEVAKLDGWKYNGTECMECWEKNNHQLDEDDLVSLSYLTSRDAIIPVIEKQHWQIRDKIALELIGNKTTLKENDLSVVLFSYPRQLCIALLKATGKWKD